MAYFPPTGSIVAFQVNPSSLQTGASVIGLAPVGIRFTDGTAVNQSAGNLMVNVGNLAIGTFGNSDGTSAGLTSGLTFSEVLIYNGTSWDRWHGDIKAFTSGGSTIYRNLDTQSTGVSIKGSAGQVYGWYIANLASSVRYVKLYNKATAPTVGTDVPVMTIPIPANAAANIAFTVGIPFSLGIGIGGVTGVADANTGAPTANDIVTNLLYF